LTPVFDSGSGKDGRFYTMIYNGGDGFKWGYKPNDWFGYDMITEFDNQVDGLEITAASDGNIVFSKAGWYVLEFICKIVGSNIQIKVVVAEGKAQVIGNCVGGGSWSGEDMTAPNGKGDWTFDGNRVDLTDKNIYSKDGMLILALTRKGQESFNGQVPKDNEPQPTVSSSSQAPASSSSQQVFPPVSSSSTTAIPQAYAQPAPAKVYHHTVNAKGARVKGNERYRVNFKF